MSVYDDFRKNYSAAVITQEPDERLGQMRGAGGGFGFPEMDTESMQRLYEAGLMNEAAVRNTSDPVRSRLNEDDLVTQYNTFYNAVGNIKNGKIYQDSLLKNTGHMTDPVQMRDTAYKWGKANGLDIDGIIREENKRMEKTGLIERSWKNMSRELVNLDQDYANTVDNPLLDEKEKRKKLKQLETKSRVIQAKQTQLDEQGWAVPGTGLIKSMAGYADDPYVWGIAGTQAALGAGAGSAAGGVGALPGATAGFWSGIGTGMAVSAQRQGAGEIYMNLSEMGIDPLSPKAKVIANAVGIGYAALEKAQVGRMGKAFTPGAKKALIKKLIQSYLTDVANNVGQEMLQGAAIQAGTNLAADKNITEGVGTRMLDEARSLPDFLVTGGLGHAVGAVRTNNAIRKKQADAKARGIDLTYDQAVKEYADEQNMEWAKEYLADMRKRSGMNTTTETVSGLETPEGDQAVAAYRPDTDTIELNKKASIQPSTPAHELMHAIAERLGRDSERYKAIIDETINNHRDEADAYAKKYKTTPEYGAEEILADRAQKYLEMRNDNSLLGLGWRAIDLIHEMATGNKNKEFRKLLNDLNSGKLQRAANRQAQAADHLPPSAPAGAEAEIIDRYGDNAELDNPLSRDYLYKTGMNFVTGEKPRMFIREAQAEEVNYLDQARRAMDSVQRGVPLGRRSLLRLAELARAQRDKISQQTFHNLAMKAQQRDALEKQNMVFRNMNKRLKLREREVRYQRQLNPKAAMYENPRKDIVDFAKWVINNPESNAVVNKTKVTQRTAGGVDLVIPAARIKHDYFKHRMTSKNWREVLENIDNVENWSFSPKNKTLGDNTILLKVGTPTGKYGVAIGLNGNTNTIATIFKDKETAIDAWINNYKSAAHQPARRTPVASSSAQGGNVPVGQRLTNIITQARERSGTNAIQRKETGAKKNNAEIVEADRYDHGGHDDTIRQRQKHTEHSGENIQPEKREKLTDRRYQRAEISSTDKQRVADQNITVANTFNDAKDMARSFIGNEIKNNKTGISGFVSNSSIAKMLSEKAVNKSISPQAQATAVANLNILFENAPLHLATSDRTPRSSIKNIHFFGTAMKYGKSFVPVKIQLREFRDNTQNKIYTVEAIDVMNEDLTGAGQRPLGDQPRLDFQNIITQFADEINQYAGDNQSGLAGTPRYQRVLEEPDFGDEESPRETAQETLKNAEVPPEVTARAVEEAMAKLKEQEVGKDEKLPVNAMELDFKDEEELVNAILPEDMEDTAREEAVKEIQTQLDEDRTEHAAAVEVLAESEEAEKAARELFSEQDAKQFAEEAREYGIRIDNNTDVQEFLLEKTKKQRNKLYETVREFKEMVREFNSNTDNWKSQFNPSNYELFAKAEDTLLNGYAGLANLARENTRRMVEIMDQDMYRAYPANTEYRAEQEKAQAAAAEKADTIATRQAREKDTGIAAEQLEELKNLRHKTEAQGMALASLNESLATYKKEVERADRQDKKRLETLLGNVRKKLAGTEERAKKTRKKLKNKVAALKGLYSLGRAREWLDRQEEMVDEAVDRYKEESKQRQRLKIARDELRKAIYNMLRRSERRARARLIGVKTIYEMEKYVWDGIDKYAALAMQNAKPRAQIRLVDLFGFDQAELERAAPNEILADVVENLKDEDLRDFYVGLKAIYDKGRKEQAAKLQAERQRQVARGKEIIQGIVANSKNNIFKFATDDLEYADIQAAEKALMANNFDQGERDRLREVIRKSAVTWGKIKRDWILKELPPQMIHKMLDDKNDTLLKLFRDAIETPDNARQDLIQKASKPFYEAYKALYEAKDTPGVRNKIMIGGRPFSAEQAIALALYNEQAHTAELLARNNNPEMEDWHTIDTGLRAERYKNRITPAELAKLTKTVESTPALKAVKDAAQKAFEVNKDLLKDASENVLNVFFEEQDNYFPFRLVRAGAESEQEMTDLIGRVWQSQTGSLRTGNLERRIKHRHAINWANASLSGMVNRAVANQARVIAFAQAARDYTRILGQIKPTIDTRAGNTAITAELKTFGADIFYGNENNYQGVDAWLAKFRSRVYPSALAFNIRTPFRQILGLFTAAAQSDLKTITSGIRLAANKDNWEKAYSKSAVLRNSAIDQYYAEAMWAKETTAAPNALVSAWRKFWDWGLKPLEISDRAVRVAAWMGAYDKALKSGRSEEEAIAAGDYLVSSTQNMSSKIYQPAIMRSSQWAKTFFMYGSQAFQQFGIYANLLNRMRNGTLSKKDFGLGIFWMFLMGWLFNRIISSAFKRKVWEPSSYLLKKHPVQDITLDMLSFITNPALAKFVDTARFGGEITSSLPGEILSSATGILRGSLSGEWQKAGKEALKTGVSYYGGNPRILSQFVGK